MKGRAVAGLVLVALILVVAAPTAAESVEAALKTPFTGNENPMEDAFSEIGMEEPYASVEEVPKHHGEQLTASTSTSTETHCYRSTPTVCVTPLAKSVIICDSVSAFDWCKGTGIVGGFGHSPVGLPGWVSWNGYSQCWNDCSGSERVFDLEAWSGAAWDWRDGSFEKIAHDTETTSLSCISYSVYSRTHAEAGIAFTPMDVSGHLSDHDSEYYCG